MSNYKVVFHINEQNKWDHLIANVNNLIKSLGQDTQIEVVANGRAVVDYCNNEKLIENMNELKSLGVTFTACRNSLISNKINECTLPNVVIVVLSGVTEIIMRQSEGFLYLKV
ncbi:MAG: hypothetical protein K0Q49_2057 [Haloplasmataceae bacterium]|nr:hypothetical protein [Haloplasmataceae bacterium]